MELQFGSNSYGCMRRMPMEAANQELTQEVRLSEGMPDIGRVLCSWAQVILRSKEWMADTVTISGGVMVWILYAPEDGSQPRCMDTWIPYQLRWNSMEPGQEGPLHIMPLLRFVDSRTVSPRKFMVRTGVAAVAEAFRNDSFEIFAPAELPDDIQVNKRTYPVRLLKEAGEKMFQVEEDLPFPDAVPEKIICYHTRPSMTEVRVLNNRIVFRGRCNLHVVYQCQEGRLCVQDFELPYSQYADLKDSYSSDAGARVQMVVTNLELNLNTDSIRVKCALVGQYLIDDRFLVELVEDAYSNRREVSLKNQVLHLPAVLERRKESVPVSVHMNGVTGEVVDVFELADKAIQRTRDQGVVIENAGISQILYRDESGSLQSALGHWEVSKGLPADETCSVQTKVYPEGRFQPISGTEGVELRGQVEFAMETMSTSGMDMVTGMEIGEVRKEDSGRPSLVLRQLDGYTLWELAKNCGSTRDLICQVNEIQDDAKIDGLVLIPVE